MLHTAFPLSSRPRARCPRQPGGPGRCKSCWHRDAHRRAVCRCVPLARFSVETSLPALYREVQPARCRRTVAVRNEDKPPPRASPSSGPSGASSAGSPWSRRKRPSDQPSITVLSRPFQGEKAIFGSSPGNGSILTFPSSGEEADGRFCQLSDSVTRDGP